MGDLQSPGLKMIFMTLSYAFIYPSFPLPQYSGGFPFRKKSKRRTNHGSHIIKGLHKSGTKQNNARLTKEGVEPDNYIRTIRSVNEVQVSWLASAATVFIAIVSR